MKLLGAGSGRLQPNGFWTFPNLNDLRCALVLFAETMNISGLLHVLGKASYKGNDLEQILDKSRSLLTADLAFAHRIPNLLGSAFDSSHFHRHILA